MAHGASRAGFGLAFAWIDGIRVTGFDVQSLLVAPATAVLLVERHSRTVRRALT